MKQRKKWPLINLINSALIDLPAPSNITNMWNFGSILGFCLLIQIISGVFLAIHYSSDVSLAFECVNHIIRDVNSGWFIRFIHANGASLFFLIIYIHIGRGVYFNSFVLNLTWIVGVLIFLLTILTGFLGYVLPWGQISYWGATVITNLLSAVPYLGTLMVEWVWGGFSVNNSTLTRFFRFHYLFPFIVILLVIVHLVFLHEQKSSNPLGVQIRCDKIPFYPYFYSKDLLRTIIILLILILFNFLAPFLLIDPENFIPANPLSTPVHIQPEWYFLFAYAILRSIPNKLGGVLALLLSILILIPLALKNKTIQYNKINFIRPLFWVLLILFIALTWLGTKPVEEPYLALRTAITVLYFGWFIIILTLP